MKARFWTLWALGILAVIAIGTASAQTDKSDVNSNANVNIEESGYGLAIANFIVNDGRASAIHGERFPITLAAKNVGAGVFSAGQIGVALADSGGNIVEVIDTRDWNALAPGAQRTQNMSNVRVPKSVAPGKYSLMVAVRPAGGEWQLVTAAVGGVSNKLGFSVEDVEESGHGAAIEGFIVDKASVYRNELFIVKANIRNRRLDAFPIGHIGAALVNDTGAIVRVVGNTKFDSLSPGYLRFDIPVNCIVPNSVEPGSYRLRVVMRPRGGDFRIVTMTGNDAPSVVDIAVTAGEKQVAAVTHFTMTGGKIPAPPNERFSIPQDSFPLAIRMVESRIDRLLLTPVDIIEKQVGRKMGRRDKVELVSTRELEDGKIEVVARHTIGQWRRPQDTTARGRQVMGAAGQGTRWQSPAGRGGVRWQTTTWTMALDSPKSWKNAFSFGAYGGENEELSAYDALRLVEQSKGLYVNDPDYRRVVDIVERGVVTKLQYDWDSFLNKKNRPYEEAVQIGTGVCAVYARRTKELLAAAGYKVENWTSAVGNHAWNHVIMPSGRTLYIDATWYDNCSENNPTNPNPAPDVYSPWYITYDKNLFERGLKGTIRMHGAWGDAKKF